MPTLSQLLKMEEEARLGGGVSTPPTVAPENPFEAAFRRQRPPKREETEGRGAVEALLDYAARPQRAMVGGIRGAYKDDLGVLEGIGKGFSGESQAGFKEILNDAGVEGNKARYGGMALDMVLDPLNALPVGAIGKLGKGLGAVGKMLPGGAKVAEVAGGVKKAAMSSKFARAFDAYSGLEPEVAKAVRLAQAEARTTAERVIEGLQKTAGKTPGKTKLDEIEMEELQKLVGSIKHQQTDKAIRDFAAKVDPKKYKDMVRVGDVEGFSAIKRENLEAFGKANPKPKAPGKTPLGRGPDTLQKEAIRQANAQARQAYAQQLDALTQKRLQTAQQFDDLQVPKEFLDTLRQQSSKFELPKSLRRLDKGWKEAATVWNPRFHVNNVIGNLWNMAINNPDRLSLTNNPIAAYMKGNKFIRKINKGTLTPDEQKLSEALKRYGVDTGLTQHINYDPTSTIEAVRDAANKVAGKGNWATKIKQKVGKIGDRSERAAKIGTVLQELGKGKKLDDAIIHTKDTLFDYQEVTPELRFLRDTVAPFLTFKAKNTALQPKGYLKHPELFAAVGKGRQDLENEAKTKGTYIPERDRHPLDVLNGITSLPLKLAGLPVSARNPLPLSDLNALSALNPSTRAGKLSRRGLLADTIGPLPQLALKMTDVDIRNPKRTPTPPEGLLGKVPANPLIQAVTPNEYNTHRNKSNPKATELRIPYLLNEMVNMFPPANSWGRAGLSLSDPELANDPLASLAFLGVPITAMKPATRQMNRTYNARDYSTMKNSIQRKERDRVGPDPLDRILRNLGKGK